MLSPHRRLSCPERWPRAAVLRALTPAVARRRPSLTLEALTRQGREASVGGPPATLRVAPDEARAQAGTSMHTSGGSSPVPFRWPIVMQMSPPVLQRRRGWVSRLPQPRSPPARGHEHPQQSSPGSPETRCPAQGPWACGARGTCRGSLPSAPAPSVPGDCRLAPSHAWDLRFGRGWPPLPSQGPRPRHCPCHGPAALGRACRAGVLWTERPWPLPARDQQHCPRRDSCTPLRTHGPCPAGKPARVSVTVPSGPELLSGHILSVPCLAATLVCSLVGGF